MPEKFVWTSAHVLLITDVLMIVMYRCNTVVEKPVIYRLCTIENVEKHSLNKTLLKTGLIVQTIIWFSIEIECLSQ